LDPASVEVRMTLPIVPPMVEFDVDVLEKEAINPL